MKWATNEQDDEDFEQERLIEQWLEREGKSGSIDLKHITSKGTVRNTLVKASISLDQEITQDGGGTFADLIAGLDGRDLEIGSLECDPEGDAREQIFWYLSALGFNQGEIEWLIKTLKLSIQENKSLFEKLAISSEW